MPPRSRSWRFVVPTAVVALVGLSALAIVELPGLSSSVSATAITPADLQDAENPAVLAAYELERTGLGILPITITDVELPLGFQLVGAGIMPDDGSGATSFPEVLEQAEPLPARVPAGKPDLVLAWTFDCAVLTSAVRADPAAWVAQTIDGYDGTLLAKPVLLRTTVLGVVEHEHTFLATPQVSLEDACGIPPESLGLTPAAESAE